MADVHVTEAESAILEALWRCGPLPPVRLIAEVKAARPWADTTIKTLLGRLMHKRIVGSERTEGVLRYRALIDRGAYVEAEVRALVARLFAGDPQALLAFLAQRRERAAPISRS
jgi:BlaI family penicillinase repressor